MFCDGKTIHDPPLNVQKCFTAHPQMLKKITPSLIVQ